MLDVDYAVHFRDEYWELSPDFDSSYTSDQRDALTTFGVDFHGYDGLGNNFWGHNIECNYGTATLVMIFATIDQCERIHAMHELESGIYYSWLQGNSSEYASELSRLQSKVDIL